MRRDPTISIVIPITRYVFELDEALASVFTQSLQDFEVIIIDNHATTEAREVAEKWLSREPERIKIIREEIRGLVSARNRGISESKGEYIALLDSDDRMRPERLQIQLDKIQKNDNIVLVGSWTDELSPDGTQIQHKHSIPTVPRWWKILFSCSHSFFENPFYEPRPSTFFFRASIARKIGMFDLRFDPFWLEDTDFAFRMYLEGKVTIVPQSLVEYRTHPESDSLRRIFDFGLIEKHHIFFSILRERFYRKEDPQSRKAFSKLQSRWMRETGIKLLAMKNGEEMGKALIKKAFYKSPFDIQNIEALLRINLSKSLYPRAFGVQGPVNFSVPDHVDRGWIESLFSLDQPTGRSLRDL